jgi:hypothetical protein
LRLATFAAFLFCGFAVATSLRLYIFAVLRLRLLSGLISERFAVATSLRLYIFAVLRLRLFCGLFFISLCGCDFAAAFLLYISAVATSLRLAKPQKPQKTHKFFIFIY